MEIAICAEKFPVANVVKLVLELVPQTTAIWLHGSRVTGKVKRNSDWDFCVVVPNNLDRETYLDHCVTSGKLQRTLHAKYPRADVQLAYQSSTAEPGSVGWWATTTGKLLWPSG